VTLVSVVVPTRDRRAALDRALESVVAQGIDGLEMLVVDDASRDGTGEWLRREWPQARVFAGAGRGAGAARNLAVAAAQGELIAFLDDDDRWRPSYLKMQIGALAADPGLDLVYSDHVEVDGAGRVGMPDLRPLARQPSELLQLLADGGIHTMSAVVCRRELFVRRGGFDESLRVVEDLEWYARQLAGGARFARLPRALVERGVPGGLVTAHRTWYGEERAIHARLLAANATPRQRRRVRAARALLFARIGLAKADYAFGAARLAEALTTAPLAALRLAAIRLARNWRRDARHTVPAWGSVARPAS